MTIPKKFHYIVYTYTFGVTVIVYNTVTQRRQTLHYGNWPDMIRYHLFEDGDRIKVIG